MKYSQGLKELPKHGTKFRFVLNDAMFNRFNHSVGTGNKKNQLIINLLLKDILEHKSDKDLNDAFQSNFQELQKSIKEPIDKVDLIAEEILSYMHDCMHLPFSHLFESEIIHMPGFHEELVKKALLEDNTLHQIFDSIHPRLNEALEHHINEKSIFSPFNASSLDLDRFDYIFRGLFYKGDITYDANFPPFTFDKVTINGKEEIVPVYDIKDYDKIKTILECRADLYLGELGYLSSEVIIADAVFGQALNAILKNSSESSGATPESFEKLKSFISSFSRR